MLQVTEAIKSVITLEGNGWPPTDTCDRQQGWSCEQGASEGAHHRPNHLLPL